MADLIGIGGKSGSGKSTSLQNLNPAETFVVSLTGKPLPIPGFKSKYKTLKKTAEGYVGNFYTSNKIESIVKILEYVNKKMSDIKLIVIDDANYLMSFETMDRAEEKGWDEIICPY